MTISRGWTFDYLEGTPILPRYEYMVIKAQVAIDSLSAKAMSTVNDE